MANRQISLWQARLYWPRPANDIYNTYRGNSELIICGTENEILSKEGVIQGDPLSMPLCTYLFFYPVQSFDEFYPSGHSNVCSSLLFDNIVNTLLGTLEEHESGGVILGGLFE